MQYLFGDWEEEYDEICTILNTPTFFYICHPEVLDHAGDMLWNFMLA